MTNHMHCYGKLFPSRTWHDAGKDRPNAVFGYVYGECGTVPRKPEITIDLESWDRCVECAEFASCRELSTAKLFLELAVA